MSIIDKLSQMFDDVMEKAIEQHRKSSLFRGGDRKKVAIPLSQEEKDQTASEFQQTQLDIADTKRAVARARLQSQRTGSKLRKAQDNLSQLTSPGSMAPAAAVEQARKEVRRENRRHKQVQTKRERVESRLNRSKKRNQELFEILRTGTKEGEILTPTKEQKKAAFGGFLDTLGFQELTGSSGRTVMKASDGDKAAKMQMLSDQIQGVSQGLGDTTKTNRADAVGAGLMKSGFHAAFATGNLGAAAVLKFGELLLNSTSKLRDWTESLHQSNVKFSEYSASMMKVKIDQEVRDIYYSQARGDARAASAEKLAEAKHALNKELAPIEDDIADMQNKAGTLLSRFLQKSVRAYKNFSDQYFEATGGGFSRLLFGIPDKPVKKVDETYTTSQWMQEVWEQYGVRKWR